MSRQEKPHALQSLTHGLTAQQLLLLKARRNFEGKGLPKIKPLDLPKVSQLLDRGHTDTTLSDAAESELREVFDKITEAVQDLFLKSGLDKDQPLVLQPGSEYPMKLNLLIRLMLGPEGSPRGGRLLYQKMQREKIIGWTYVIRALVGAAVYSWCLPVPALKRQTLDERHVYQNYGAGIIQKVLEKSIDPVLEMILRKKFFAAHIDENVMPKIKAEAEDMAFYLHTFVDLLLPRSPTIARPPKENEFETKTEADPIHPDAFQLPDVSINFHQSLISIFDTALRWWASKDKLVREDYNFHFPSNVIPVHCE